MSNHEVRVLISDDDCEFCAVKWGRHGHLLRDDGSIGTVVLSDEQLQARGL